MPQKKMPPHTRGASEAAISDERARFSVYRVPFRFIPPQLATSVDKPPEGKGWIHEIKHDGYRCQVLLERGRVRVLTRNGHDWTDRYPSIVLAAGDLPCKSAILDGEAVVQGAKGVSDFGALAFAMRWRPHTVIFYAFDLMHLNGRDLRHEPLSERRSTLQNSQIGTDNESCIQFSEGFQGDSAAFFNACADKGLEGIVSKTATSRYRSGRTNSWLKTKCFVEFSFVVVGTDRDRRTGALRALLAHSNSDGLRYAGSVYRS